MTTAKRLDASLHAKVWGSTRLQPWFADATDKIGEVWFTSTPRPPLLAKFLFTTEKLSVQVHPGGPNGKTEMWHVLRADPGAPVAVGFREPVTDRVLRESSISGEIEGLLNWIPVQAGDSVFVPAGTVHAIGAGLAICEIQQYSDITFRLYDYGRPRELHVDQAAAVAHLGTHPGVSTPAGEVVASCEYFETRRISISGGRELVGDMLVILEGSGQLDDQPCRLGEVWRLNGRVSAAGNMEALLVSVP